MTFSVSGSRGDPSLPRIDEKRALPALAVLRHIEAKLKHGLPTAEEPAEVEPVLTQDDMARLRCEGRNAAFAGLSARSCPYAVSSRAQREAWLEGFHTSR
ncbi:hypothetical protein ASG25_05935 [Rhizobium sp. Leaf384]|uniref:Rmf/CrpP family protein n=1 Tax=unclassified Rhizobium TaxID=2613769 RepID=UPI0007138CAD|nr:MULTISPECIES: Rmf/CrpP family protein [unclassified Rhizobium]KQS81041.1 hypothetical protein ASG25_05935 [Rhizobium sp. Leaf384]KQS86895.1 hypothetical protein ASG58_01195 [Rhizobium sp. Leaf383]